MQNQLIELFEENRDKIFRLGMSYFGNANDAADLVQEVFIKFMNLNRQDSPVDPAGYLYRMAQNLAKNIYRRNKRFQPINDADQLNSESNIATHCERMEQNEILIRALASLSPVMRETARLNYLSGFSTAEIIHNLKIPAGTLKRRLFTARNQIKNEVLKMTNHGLDISANNLIPLIEVNYLQTTEILEISPQGYGQCFGSVLVAGDNETVNFYDYPGGILTLTTKTSVTRELEITGVKMWEVIIENFEDENSAERQICFFSKSEPSISWELKIETVNGLPVLSSKPDNSVTPAKYSSANNSNQLLVRKAELNINNKKYNCISVLSYFADGTPMENFYLLSGREILHRRYAGANAKLNRFYKFETLPEEGSFISDNIEYRIWYDSLLMNC